MDELETRELRAFVALGEELHFGRAAERLHVAQPAVSRTLAKLEDRLGVRLVERTTRAVALTPPGQVLLDEARGALTAIEAAARRTRRAADGCTAVVLAVKPDGDAGLLEAPLASDPPALRPLFFSDAAELTAAVLDGRADAALVQRPFDTTGLAHREVSYEPRVVALASHHPLATAERLSLGDLREEPAATWAGADPRLDAFYRGADDEGRDGPARRGPEVSDLSEALRLVELGHAITFVPRSVADRFARQGITYRDVTGLGDSRLDLVWRAGAQPPSVLTSITAR